MGNVDESAIKNQGKEYLKHVCYNKKRFIDMCNSTMSGMPIITGRRINISLIIDCIKDGMSINEICREYDITKQDMFNLLEYIVDILDYPFY